MASARREDETLGYRGCREVGAVMGRKGRAEARKQKTIDVRRPVRDLVGDFCDCGRRAHPPSAVI